MISCSIYPLHWEVQVFGTSLKWAWKGKCMPVQSLLPSLGHLKALWWSPEGCQVLSEQCPPEQSPWVLCQLGHVFQAFVLPAKKKCWCLGTFKFGFGPPCLVYKPKKQNKKGQVKMVLCLLPFLFSFLLFGERFAGFWAPTLLAYFNFALSHFSLHLNLSLLFSSHSHLHGTSLQILE